MTDFNYDKFSTEVLINALKREQFSLAHMESENKRFAKKIQRRRGYSRAALEAYRDGIEIRKRQILRIQEEISELESVIAQRAV